MPALRVDDNVVTLWPDHLHTSVHPAAWDAINPEAVSSAPGILRSLRARMSEINADRELSEVGKRARIEAIADSAIGNLAGVAKKVRALEQGYEADASAAVVIPKADQNDTLVDLALASWAKQQEMIPSKLERQSDRLRLALVRMPTELTGVAPEIRERLRGSFVSPDKALELQHRSEAIGAARETVQRVIDLLSPAASNMTGPEKQALFGDGWRLRPLAGTPTVPGIVPSLKTNAKA